MPSHTKVAIIGAGFGGLGAAIKLQKSGLSDFVMLDRGDNPGGTWRDNTYPGAACDVPSHLYSYSFALNPNWTRSFSKQEEIHQYIQDVFAKHALAERTYFGTEVTRAAWDEVTALWRIETSRGAMTADFVVGAVGPLCEPKLPEIKGIDTFTGKIVHSSRWDHQYPVAGKRVAVIGTGASAVQLIPELAGAVGHLDVYQRTAPWVLPRADRPYSAAETKAFNTIPGFQRLARTSIYANHEAFAFAMNYAPTFLRIAKVLGAKNIQHAIADPQLRAKVTPTFTPGCKRILMSNTYYPALAQPNTDLITSGIKEITETSIVTNDGVHHDVDAIVVATGFHVTDSPAFDHIIGRGGKSLAQTWSDGGMAAYKGSFVHGYPNLFLMIGPATGLGHTSMIFMIESQLNYLIDMLKKVDVLGRTGSTVTLDVRAGVQGKFNRWIQRGLRRSVWVNGGCDSWYQDEHGNITTLWPGFTFVFRARTRRFDVKAYDVATKSRPRLAPTDPTQRPSTPTATPALGEPAPTNLY